MERSAAEMPVVVLTWSMLTVKAVSWLSVFSETICSRLSLCARSRLIGMQMSPLATLAIRLTFAWVANSAAQIMSPSFSRSGSSTTMMTWPARSSSSASGMVFMLIGGSSRLGFRDREGVAAAVLEAVRGKVIQG